MELWHCTTRDAVRLIAQDRLHPGSWVTPADVTSLGRDQRVKALELNENRKGECACKVKADRTDFTVPKEYPLTSSGYPQLRTLRHLPVVEADCKCESDSPWGAIVLIGGLLLLGSLLLRNRWG